MKKGGKKDVLESLDFIIKHMATKDDVHDVVKEVTEPQFKKIDDRLAAVENKIGGIYRTFTDEAMKARDFKIPKRVHRLEEKVFGTGGSQHPRNLPF